MPGAGAGGGRGQRWSRFGCSRIEPGKRFVGHPQALSHNESSSIVVADAKSTTAPGAPRRISPSRSGKAGNSQPISTARIATATSSVRIACASGCDQLKKVTRMTASTAIRNSKAPALQSRTRLASRTLPVTGRFKTANNLAHNNGIAAHRLKRAAAFLSAFGRRRAAEAGA
jgi:hypothetical protein